MSGALLHAGKPRRKDSLQNVSGPPGNRTVTDDATRMPHSA